MTKRLLPSRWQAMAADGRPLAGATLTTYASGTSTPKATYTDAGLSVAAANPVTADANGRFPEIFLGTGSYKFVLKDAAGNTITTDDPVDGNDASFGDGSASAPSIAFGSDPNTGLFRPGADAIAITTGGVERFRVTASGNVGVAVTAPVVAFHVGLNAMIGGAASGETAVNIFSSSSAAAGLEAVDATNSSTKKDLLLQQFGGKLYSLGVYNSTSGSAANVVVASTGELSRSTSSRRYKSDIQSMEPAACLLRVMKWRPVTYLSTTEDSGIRYAGFIAEEIDAAGAVEYVEYARGVPDALRYPQMVADLAGAVQALADRVARLEQGE